MKWKEIADGLARLGIMGVVAIAVVGTLIFIAVYGVITMPDADITDRAVTVIIVGTGGVIMAAGRFFGGGNG